MNFKEHFYILTEGSLEARTGYMVKTYGKIWNKMWEDAWNGPEENEGEPPGMPPLPPGGIENRGRRRFACRRSKKQFYI